MYEDTDYGDTDYGDNTYTYSPEKKEKKTGFKPKSFKSYKKFRPMSKMRLNF